jgi:hypothetical protein
VAFNALVAQAATRMTQAATPSTNHLNHNDRTCHTVATRHDNPMHMIARADFEAWFNQHTAEMTRVARREGFLLGQGVQLNRPGDVPRWLSQYLQWGGDVVPVGSEWLGVFERVEESVKTDDANNKQPDTAEEMEKSMVSKSYLRLYSMDSGKELTGLPAPMDTDQLGAIVAELDERRALLAAGVDADSKSPDSTDRKDRWKVLPQPNQDAGRPYIYVSRISGTSLLYDNATRIDLYRFHLNERTWDPHWRLELDVGTNPNTFYLGWKHFGFCAAVVPIRAEDLFGCNSFQVVFE